MSFFPQVILDSTFFSVTNDCYLSSDFLLSCEHQHHNPTFTLCFYLQLLGRVAGANPSISIPSGLHFHAQKAGGGRELRGSLTCCLPEGRPPFYLCRFWQTCVSYILWWLPGAEMPLHPQAACSQVSPSFSLEKIFSRKLSFFFFFYPLYQGWGELSIFSLPQFFTYPHNTKSPVSVICAEVFFQPFPMLSSPWSHRGHRKGWRAQCCPTSEILCPWQGLGAHAEARLLAPVGTLCEGQLSWQGNQCLVLAGNRVSRLCAPCELGSCCSSQIWPQRRLLSITAPKCCQSAVLPISDEQRLMDTAAAGAQSLRSPQGATALWLTLKSVTIEIQELFTKIKYLPWAGCLYLAFEKGKLLQSWHAV